MRYIQKIFYVLKYWHQNSEILRTIFQSFNFIKNHWKFELLSSSFILYRITNKDLPLKEAFLRFSLIGSKVMHHCWQSQWPKSCTWFIKMPGCLTVKKKWWNGRKSLRTLIQNKYVSFPTFAADLCKNMISCGIYFQGLIWKFCVGKRVATTFQHLNWNFLLLNLI